MFWHRGWRSKLEGADLEYLYGCGRGLAQLVLAEIGLGNHVHSQPTQERAASRYQALQQRDSKRIERSD